jgi:hypothetical protein
MKRIAKDIDGDQKNKNLMQQSESCPLDLLTHYALRKKLSYDSR